MADTQDPQKIIDDAAKLAETLPSTEPVKPVEPTPTLPPQVEPPAIVPENPVVPPIPPVAPPPTAAFTPAPLPPISNNEPSFVVPPKDIPKTDTIQKPKPNGPKGILIAGLLFLIMTLPVAIYFISQSPQLADLRSRAAGSCSKINSAGICANVTCANKDEEACGVGTCCKWGTTLQPTVTPAPATKTPTPTPDCVSTNNGCAVGGKPCCNATASCFTPPGQTETICSTATITACGGQGETCCSGNTCDNASLACDGASLTNNCYTKTQCVKTRFTGACAYAACRNLPATTCNNTLRDGGADVQCCQWGGSATPGVADCKNNPLKRTYINTDKGQAMVNQSGCCNDGDDPVSATNPKGNGCTTKTTSLYHYLCNGRVTGTYGCPSSAFPSEPNPPGNLHYAAGAKTYTFFKGCGTEQIDMVDGGSLSFASIIWPTECGATATPTIPSTTTDTPTKTPTPIPNTPTRTITSTATPTTPPSEPGRCDASCGSNSDCESGNVCAQIADGIKRCRNASCIYESSCSCPANTATPTTQTFAAVVPENSPTPQTPKVPVSGIGPGFMGIATVIGSVLLLLIGLAL